MTSQRLIIVLSCCLGICLFALGFLLGRESNRAAATVVSAPVEVTAAEPMPVPSQAPAPTVAPVAPEAASQTAGAPAASSRAKTAPVRLSPQGASPALADVSSDKQAVASYFRDVDRLQDVDVADPEAAATSLIGAATSGDTSGLRKLVSQARDTEQKVRAITPPPACAQYHERLLSLHAESRSMLQQLEQGLGGGELESLPALLSRANTAKSRSEALANEAREIKRRHGIEP